MSEFDELYLKKFFQNRLPHAVVDEWGDKMVEASEAAIRADREGRVPPTDEEISEWINSHAYYGYCTAEYHEGLKEGAEWMRSQILNKTEKEQS